MATIEGDTRKLLEAISRKRLAGESAAKEIRKLDESRRKVPRKPKK